MRFWEILMFSRLDERDQRALCNGFRPMSMTNGNVVYERGQFGIGIYVIAQGKVKLMRRAGISRAVEVLTDMEVDWKGQPPPADKLAFGFTFRKGYCFGEVETIAQIESAYSIPR